MDSLMRELRFALKDKVVVFTLVVSAILSSYTIGSGLKEVAAERALIERVYKLVTEDREFSLAKQSDAGGAAYYAFHFTYDLPSSLAFVSRGLRDDLPWKHRLRMLALEGQIYETDAGNPELSRIGKLDFAFIAAFLLPLLSILILYDLRAVEVRNNRWAFLSATSGNGHRLLKIRASIRTALLYLAVILPFILVAISNAANLSNILIVAGVAAINLIFWLLIALLISTKIESGPTAAALLLGCWFAIAVIVPVGGKFLVESLITVPKGGELLLTQREAVNDAWDLPKEDTMQPFYQRHPVWAKSAAITRPFEWKWYFAFQQVGDQTVEPLSNELRTGILRRDRAMRLIAFFSPSLLTDRLLSKAAATDIDAFQSYDRCVRNYHKQLRDFYYPMLFADVAYSGEQMENLPEFVPCEK